MITDFYLSPKLKCKNIQILSIVIIHLFIDALANKIIIIYFCHSYKINKKKLKWKACRCSFGAKYLEVSLMKFVEIDSFWKWKNPFERKKVFFKKHADMCALSVRSQAKEILLLRIFDVLKNDEHILNAISNNNYNVWRQ